MTAVVTSSLSIQTGAPPSFAAAALSNTVECPVGGNHNLFVVFRNANAATRTVTAIVPGNTSYGSALPDPSATLPAVAAGIPGELWFPVTTEMLNVNGVAEFQIDVITNVTISCVKVG